MPRFEIVTEPIDRWPEPDTEYRKAAQFTAGYDNTLNILRRELDYLDASGPAVIQVVTRNGAGDLRRDGALRMDARIQHPGVRLSFLSDRLGQLTYATDVFTDRYRTPGWINNLRAIALGLESLRAVDRYGITRSGEQYKGWLAIEGAGPDLDGARRTIWTYATGGDLMATPAQADWRDLYRQARRLVHPDRMGDGGRQAWDDVEAAAKVLGVFE